MTEIATRDEPVYRFDGVDVIDPTGGRLVAWASGLSAAHRIGNALCQTSFAPAHFRNKPDEAAAAILFGDEIGLTPTQALRSIHVIAGTPGLYARTMVALVMSRGHEVWTIEKSDSKVTVAGRRRGSTHTIEETWTVARAQKAGYTSNKKYTTDPQSMLYARCAADVCRQIAPDALAGLSFTLEELDLENTSTTTMKRSSAVGTTRKAQRAPLAPVPEPELDGTPLDPDAEPFAAETAEEVAAEAATGMQDEGAEPAVTRAQQQKLHALLNEHGYGDRDDKLRYLTSALGREISSANDLTRSEASRLIESLEGPFDPSEPPL